MLLPFFAAEHLLRPRVSDPSPEQSPCQEADGAAIPSTRERTQAAYAVVERFLE